MKKIDCMPELTALLEAQKLSDIEKVETPELVITFGKSERDHLSYFVHVIKKTSWDSLMLYHDSLPEKYSEDHRLHVYEAAEKVFNDACRFFGLQTNEKRTA